MFSLSWDFNHVTSSPHYAKANSKAQSLVKTVKQLFKKAERDGKDPWLAFLDYRSTPIRGLGASPAQRLISRRARTLPPTKTSLTLSEIIPDSTEQLEWKRRKANVANAPANFKTVTRTIQFIRNQWFLKHD